MANARQKKKKNAATAKQAAAAYKGKNAPIKPAAAKKPQEVPVASKPEAEKVELPNAEIIKTEAQKAEPKKTDPKKVDHKKNEPKKADAKKAEQKKAKSKKSDSAKSSKSKSAKKLPQKSKSDSLKSKIKAFGITKIAAIVLAISVVIASVAVIMWVRNNTESRVIPPDAVPKYNGMNISAENLLPVIEDLAVQQEFASRMIREGDTDAFLYYASDELLFPEKNSQASINLVNVSSNKCVLIASVVDEAGNICFQSRGLPPGNMLSDIGINNQPYGKHKMMLVVAAYDPNSYELIGVQSSDLTVQVGIEEDTSYGQNN